MTRIWHCRAMLRPTPDREAVDGCDQGLGELRVLGLSAAAPLEQRAVRVFVRRADALRLVLGEELDVTARAEGGPAPVTMPT
ncbi:MAG: hypothetical protein WDM88_03935 [Galbitalea sp.]